MRAVDIIAKKRDGGELSAAEIDSFIQGFIQDEIPDYQAAAWLMTIYLQGMSRQETIDLTMAMACSGQMLDLDEIAPLVVDKHSTGGVGDKTTLAVAPLVASTGLPVGKMSGRALSFSGGTLDKLESIPGFQADITTAEFLAQLRTAGLVVCGQTADLAPADGKLYALRDVTATVSCLPLIASSIMSKKIASGASAIVLDVKVGRGAFMKTKEEATALACLMVEIGQGVDRQVRAVLSDMNQPLGRAVGNALELKEALDTLHGHGPQDFLEHCLSVAGQMLILGGKAHDAEEARATLLEALHSGRALAKFREWISAQGGDLAAVDDPSRLPQAAVVQDVPAPRAGYVAGVDAMEVGLTAMLLGAGRAKKGDPVDHAVGVVLRAKVGDYVKRGEPLLTIHANNGHKLAQATERLLAACTWSEEPVQAPPLLYEIIQRD
ncbi:MAG: pyrimidine-nucleoside phosphorylase [Anaerolineales bacterium]|nr:MAG: pyrimidine-nucleoside phosphorylase [Anaerolineales bacterium]